MGSSVQGAAVNFKKLSTLIRFSLKVTKILKPESTKPYNSELLFKNSSCTKVAGRARNSSTLTRLRPKVFGSKASGLRA